MTDGCQDSPGQPEDGEETADSPASEGVADDPSVDGASGPGSEFSPPTASPPSNLTTGVLHQFVQGDDDALGHFIRLEEKQLLSYIDRKLSTHVRGPGDIDDIFQELLITLHKKRVSGDLEVINTPAFMGLVIKIIDGLISHAVEAAHRKKRDVRRKQSPVNKSVLSSMGGDLFDRLAAKVESPSLPAHRAEQVAAVRRCLEMMSEDDVEIWFLVMNCDTKKKYESIAKELNITAGAAAKRFERASKNLQTLLQREYPDSI
jgi:RNA polymerase sigma factor (sigma-70 family)